MYCLRLMPGAKASVYLRGPSVSPIRFVGRVLFAVAAAILVLSTGEALWWNNAQSTYPRAFFGNAPPDATNLMTLRQSCGEPLEVARSGRDHAIVRCGTFWPFRSLWLVPSKYVEPTLTEVHPSTGQVETTGENSPIVVGDGASVVINGKSHLPAGQRLEGTPVSVKTAGANSPVVIGSGSVTINTNEK